LLGNFPQQPDICMWFDVFSNNQHDAPQRSFEWWTNTFQSAIKRIGKTVMVLTPWNNPIPLTRGWCIWELYCTIVTESQLDIAFNQTSKQQFIEDLDNEPLSAVQSMFSTLNCIKSKCMNILDEKQIHETIQKTVGFTKLNQKIFEN
jgi:hypothetical protein